MNCPERFSMCRWVALCLVSAAVLMVGRTVLQQQPSAESAQFPDHQRIAAGSRELDARPESSEELDEKTITPPSVSDAAKEVLAIRGKPPVVGVDAGSVPVGADLIEPEVRANARGEAKRHRIMRMDFKYPMICGEEDTDGSPVASAADLQHARIADHLIVHVRPGITEGQVRVMADELGMAVRERVGPSDCYLVSYPVHDFDSQDRAFDLLASRKEVAMTDYDGLIKLAATPNDSSYGQLWGMNKISAPQAWNTATGNRSVVVGVIDTGIDYNHPDLAANIWTNPGESGTDSQGRDKRSNGVDDDGNGYVDDWRGWDFMSGDNDPMDPHSHGTHCAGTIGAVGNNGTGVAGVCWQVSLAALKTSGTDGISNSSTIYAAIRYSADMSFPITSNSYGSSYSNSINSAVDYAASKGQLFVAAAGNDSVSTDVTPVSPASSPNDSVIAVMYTTSSDGLGQYTNYGPTTVDLAAPGAGIYSTWPGGGYGFKEGTSMACPHVAGACALLKASKPSLTAAQMKAAIMNGVDVLPSLNGKCVTGGRLNLFKSLALVLGPTAKLQSYAFEEATAGDGFLNPGEEAVGTVTLGNELIDLVPDVVASISSDDPDVTILSNTVTYGSLGAGQPSNGSGTFRFRLAVGASPRVVSLTLTISSSAGGPWVYPMTCTYVNSGAVVGYVRNAKGGGIAGATVSWSGSSAGQVTSGPDGYYALPVTDGSYQVSASASGFVSSSPISITVPPYQTRDIQLDNADLTVTPESLSPHAASGAAASADLSLASTGSLPLTWSIPVSGYQFATSDHPGGPAYVWNDISTTGTLVTGMTDDTNLGPFPLGFSMPFFGQSFSGIRICSNGWLSFTSTATEFSNTKGALPNGSLPENLIAPLLRDLKLTNAGMIHYQQVDGETFVVQFTGVPRWTSSAGPISTSLCTFQVVLKRDGTIFFYYQRADDPTVGVVGIQNAGKNLGLNLAYNQAFLKPGLAVRIQTMPSWISITPASGTIAAGSAATATVTCNATGLAEGTYSTSIIIHSNETDVPVQVVPVTFTVGATGPVDPAITEWPVAGPIVYGQALSASAMTGGSASVPGTFAFSAGGTMLDAGTHSVEVVFTPTDTAAYKPVSGNVLVSVGKATPVVTAWPVAGAIQYGQYLGASTLSGGTASVHGSFAFNDPDLLFDGQDAFTFRVSDGGQVSAAATVSITVGGAAGQAQSVSATSASRPWTPADMTTLAWYDAADVSSIIGSGNAVSQWNDKSGGNRHLSQPSGGSRPITNTASQNGLNVIAFNGTSHHIFTSTGLGSSAYSMFYVSKCDDAINNSSVAQCPVSTYGDNVSNGIGLGSSTGVLSNEVLSVLDEGVANVYTKRQAASSSKIPSISANHHLYSFVLGGDWFIGFNGVDTRDLSSGAPRNPFLFSNSFNIGAGARKTGGPVEFFFKGTMAEIILASQAVSVEDRQRIEGYLAWKWNLQENLPEDHPYKQQRPVVMLNSSPVANAQSVTVPPGVPKAITLTGSDPDGDPLTFEVVAQPVHGTLSGTPPNVIYTPPVVPAVGIHDVAVTFTPADTANYHSVTGTVVVTINGAVSPYAAWSAQYTGLDLSDASGDLDGDGMSNFHEFAFGLNPASGKSANPIVTPLDKASRRFSYTRRADSGLTYTICYSTDLRDWQDLPPAQVSEVVAEGGEAGSETVEVTLPSLPDEGNLFVRVKAR